MGEVLGKLYIRMINPAAQDGEDTCHGHSCKSHSQSKNSPAGSKGCALGKALGPSSVWRDLWYSQGLLEG